MCHRWFSGGVSRLLPPIRGSGVWQCARAHCIWHECEKHPHVRAGDLIHAAAVVRTGPRPRATGEPTSHTKRVRNACISFEGYVARFCSFTIPSSWRRAKGGRVRNDDNIQPVLLCLFTGIHLSSDESSFLWICHRHIQHAEPRDQRSWLFCEGLTVNVTFLIGSTVSVLSCIHTICIHCNKLFDFARTALEGEVGGMTALAPRILRKIGD